MSPCAIHVLDEIDWARLIMSTDLLSSPSKYQRQENSAGEQGTALASCRHRRPNRRRGYCHNEAPNTL